ncbi:MAG: CusA/CzcA family heavy metal efflux RND transporter [Moraxellaceae bacterium]|nr:MAG: CusA/CzcA family heavy metal efflux RND transporter [Moraxellaceae bacterium]
MQDWFLKYELQAVPGVSEVATVGGMVKQYQVIVEPDRLRAFGLPLSHIQTAIQRGNQEVGASVVEMSEAEYMVRATGYLRGVEDLGNIPLGVNEHGTPLLLKDVAEITVGPQMRRGIAELNGEGETVGGVVVMRFGANAQKTIERVKQKLQALKSGLPDGVEIIPVYDRSTLIERAVNNLWETLTEELIMVALVCVIFLFHVRSALVAIISLPVGILAAFIVMYMQGLNANIMSLGGIAIAIGAMVDGAIVLVENLHKHLEREEVTDENRWQVVTNAAVEVGPSLFFSLLIITVSFLPIFTLQAQEGRMFAPLAFTKTYALAAAAILAITLVPVLMGYFVRGRIISERQNPLNRILIKLYQPVLEAALNSPKVTLGLALSLLLVTLYPASQLGSEFMPVLDEGDMMYMPSTYPGISIGKARQILQQTNKLIRTVPEVDNVFGKMGRAETATDPAPLTMIETFVQLKPRDQWRPGLTPEDLKKELNQLVSLPGLTNVWVMPIKTRIDMLATGIKTPVGIKIAGPNLAEIAKIGKQLEIIVKDIPGTASVYAERVTGGRYIKVDIQRAQAARYGLNIADVQQVIATAIGGMNVTQTVEGPERYPVNIRYPQDYRNTPEDMALLPVVTPSGQRISLGDVANIYIEDGPPGIKSENARLNGWVFVDLADVDVGSYVKQAQAIVQQQLDLPAGYSITWAGQYEYIQRVKENLTVVVPFTLILIVGLLYLSSRSMTEVVIILMTLPLAMVGGIWMMYFSGFHFSVAVAVGLIALAGVAVETGVLMLQYLKLACAAKPSEQIGGQNDVGGPSNVEGLSNAEQLRDAIRDGALMRIRPVMMTAMADIAGLAPILFGTGTGSDVMSRIAAPLVGGMLSAVLLTLILLPVIFLLVKQAYGVGLGGEALESKEPF